jgi:mannosyltransferase
VLGIAGSWSTSFWGDEGPTVSAIRRSWPDLQKLVANIDAVHATYYAIAKLWTGFVGLNEFTLRGLSALGFAVATYLFFILAKKLRDENFAAVATVAFIFIPRNLYNADYARSFALSTMMALVLTLLFIRASEIQLSPSAGRTRKFLVWLAYSLTLAAAAYLFEYLLLVAAAHFVTAVLNKQRRMLAAPMILSGLIAGAIAATVVLASYGQRFQISANAEAPLSQRQVIIVQWFLTPLGGVVAWAFIVVGIARLASYAAIERRQRQLASAPSATPHEAQTPIFSISAIAFPWMLTPILVLLAANFFVPLYAIRYLSISTPAVALVVGAAFMGLRSRRLIAAGIIILALAAAPRYIQDRTTNSNVGTPDWRSVAKAVEKVSANGDAVLISPLPNPITSPRIAMRVYPDSFKKVADPLRATRAGEAGLLNDILINVDKAKSKLEKYKRVWLVVEESDPYWGTDTLISAGFREYTSLKIPHGIVMGFLKR